MRVRFSEIKSRDDVFTEQAPLRRFKKQAIQKVSVSGGGIVATQNSDLNSRFLQTSIGLGIPLGDFDNILGATPSFHVDWMDSATVIDVPHTLYNVGVQFFWRKTLSDRWGFMTIARPAVRSDFSTSQDAFRIFGLALLTWKYIPNTLSLSFGAVCLDRADIPLLPAIGMTWRPNPRMRFDLRFPESRVADRLSKNGRDSEMWTYLSAGLGGNTWAVTRRSG